MNRAELIDTRTWRLRPPPKPVSWNIDPASQIAAARRLAEAARNNAPGLQCRTHTRESVLEKGKMFALGRVTPKMEHIAVLVAQLADKKGCPARRLADHLGISIENLSGVLNRLTKRQRLTRYRFGGIWYYLPGASQ